MEIPKGPLREKYPVSWALATMGELAEAFIFLDVGGRVEIYRELGLEPFLAAFEPENPEDPADDKWEEERAKKRKELQERVDLEWAKDPPIIWLGVVKGVVK